MISSFLDFNPTSSNSCITFAFTISNNFNPTLSISFTSFIIILFCLLILSIFHFSFINSIISGFLLLFKFLDIFISCKTTNLKLKSIKLIKSMISLKLMELMKLMKLIKYIESSEVNKIVKKVVFTKQFLGVIFYLVAYILMERGQGLLCIWCIRNKNRNKNK